MNIINSWQSPSLHYFVKDVGINFDVPYKLRNSKYHNRSCASSNQLKYETVNKRFIDALKIGAQKAKKTVSVKKGRTITCNL